ncbi:uncharacterized protein LOC131162688 [Malania oleifera]|uniref:uncharacterized protein LOC131162688 n=1 Tax=Malania oleifera TaxID=397392 RepID=UPI0025AEA82B|nr:uncharacterized protein LOC131162688 [Malania oleifera]
MDSESPYQHLTDFVLACTTFITRAGTDEYIKLRLFPFSLKDKAKIYFNSLRPNSISDWTDMQREFLHNFFPFHRTQFLQEQINRFMQRGDETFQACWERFKKLINICPHHGFESWRLVNYFYTVLTPDYKQFVQTMCKGEFFSNEPDEALAFFDYLAESAQQWNTRSDRVPTAVQPLRAIGGGGRYDVKEETDIQARIAALARRVEFMELEKVKAAKSVEVCSLCADSSHKAQDCPIMMVVQESGSDHFQSANWFQQPSQSFAPQSQHPYKPHPISQNYSPPGFPSNVTPVPPKRSLEDTLQ